MVHSKNLIKERLDCKLWIEMKRSAHRQEVKVLVTQSRSTLWLHGLLPDRLLCPCNSPEYWSGLPFPSPRDLCDPRIKPGSPALHGNSLPLSHQGRPAGKIEVKVTQSRPTLCDSMDYTVHGILQAKILEWVATLFSGTSS